MFYLGIITFDGFCVAVFTCENSVWYHISVPLREVLQRSDDGSLLVDRLQGCSEWKLQVGYFKAIPLLYNIMCINVVSLFLFA